MKSLFDKSLYIASMPELEYPGEVHDFKNISNNMTMFSLVNRHVHYMETHSLLRYKSKIPSTIELKYYSSIPVPLYGYDLIETTRYNDEDDL